MASTSSTAAMSGLDQALVQLLLARGIMSDESLKASLKLLYKDFPRENRGETLTSIFQRINKNISAFSLEARSVVCVIQNPTTGGPGAAAVVHEYWHGIANLEDDHIARDMGARFNPKEIQLFSMLIQKLVEEEEMTYHDIEDMDGVPLRGLELTAAVAKFEEGYWISRANKRSLYQLGIRTYLELNPMLETAMNAIQAAREQEPQPERAAASRRETTGAGAGAGEEGEVEGEGESQSQSQSQSRMPPPVQTIRDRLPRIIVY
jgi:hypothetical protein